MIYGQASPESEMLKGVVVAAGSAGFLCGTAVFASAFNPNYYHPNFWKMEQVAAGGFAMLTLSAAVALEASRVMPITSKWLNLIRSYVKVTKFFLPFAEIYYGMCCCWRAYLLDRSGPWTSQAQKSLLIGLVSFLLSGIYMKAVFS